MTLKMVAAQLNACVGDLNGNAQKILDAARQAHAAGAQIMVTPELSLTGYPPEDLLLRPSFLRRSKAVLEQLAVDLSSLHGLSVLVGHPKQLDDGQICNAASLLQSGRVVAQYGKLELPNYAVFDEQRYFVPDGAPVVFEAQGVRVGVVICEDVWFPRAAAMSRAEGAQVLVVMNASPFHLNKFDERLRVMREHVSRHAIPAVFCNLVGGQDELIFDGDSFALDAAGMLQARALSFTEDLLAVEVTADGTLVSSQMAPPLDEPAQAYEALVLGTRDYVYKNGFKGALVGLSGGVDSALTLAIAVDALGADQVTAVMMPSPYTSAMSVEDARACAAALGVALHDLPISPAYQAFESTLAPVFAGRAPDLTEENLQSRIRGVLLMALSNKTGRLLLTTGNKSEMAVGYCTLYGDMAGGYAVIKDLLKGWVYKLSRFRNARAAAKGQPQAIPERILTRPPSAELRPDQTDQDSLPPYEVLDDILMRFVEMGQSSTEILAAGHSQEVLEQVLRLLRLSEYKRRQAAPGARITPRAFGRDWRFPLTNRFHEKEFFL
ncbi:MAG: glutamine-dependent synthetase [Pseudomonadota bacterium]|jgi:NAD+ synthase (glutamine-hydrolysing)